MNLLDRLKSNKGSEEVEAISSEEVIVEESTIPEPAPEVATSVVAQTTTERPVETKRSASEPWKPASLITIPEHMKTPGRRYRWVDTGKDGNYQKKLAEGWVVDHELSKKLNRISGSLEDSGNITSTTKVRELIVMYISEEKAIARNEYYNSQIVDGKKMKEKLQADTGGQAYGEVKTIRD